MTDTPLHDAVWNRDVARVETLLQQGANVNATNKDQFTPLHMACMLKNSTEMVRLLLTAGADATVADARQGNSCLHMAAERLDQEALKLLVTTVQDVNSLRNKYGETPVHSICKRKGATTEEMQVLIMAGGDMNAKDTSGSTPVHKAVRCHHGALAFILSLRKVDLCVLDNMGNSPLHVAVFNQYYDLVETLIHKMRPENINLQFSNGTALHKAAYKSDERMIELLIGMGGADLKVRSADGLSPFHETVHAPSFVPRVTELLMPDKNVNYPVKTTDYQNGFTALHLAAHARNLDFVKWFVQQEDANTNAVGTESNMTALHIAAQRKFFAGVRVLLEKGVDLEVQTSASGKTALHMAAFAGDPQMVQILLEGGANTAATTLDGKTPSQLAQEGGHADLATFIAGFGDTTSPDMMKAHANLAV